MNPIAKEFPVQIQIDPHTLERAKERGTNEEEIQDVINNGVTISAKGIVWAKPRCTISNKRDWGNSTNKNALK